MEEVWKVVTKQDTVKTFPPFQLRHFRFTYLPGEEEIKIMQSYVLLKLSQGFKCTAVKRDHRKSFTKVKDKLIVKQMPDVTKIFDAPTLP